MDFSHHPMKMSGKASQALSIPLSDTSFVSLSMAGSYPCDQHKGIPDK